MCRRPAVLDPYCVEFPAIDTALQEPNGLLAVGGDLSQERLLTAYSLGIFPWYGEGDPILWWSPAPRAVLFPHKFYCSKSLKKVIRQKKFTIKINTAFEDVIRHCATVFRKGGGGTWITAQMQQAYCLLHRNGFAYSFETWQDGELVGGLYGIKLGRVFFGESMFSLRSNASKVATAFLVETCKEWGVVLIDCQVSSEHMARLGAEEIPRQEFKRIISAAQK